MTTPILESDRLILQPLALDDAPAIQRLFPQWDVVRYMSTKVPWPYPADGALTYLEGQVLPRVAEGSAFHWSLRPKSDPDCFIGLITLRPNDEGDDQRGFWLDPAHHGKGLMFEAAERVTGFAFIDLKVESLTIGNAEANIASGRIKQKQGARLIKTIPADFISGRLPKQVWRIDRAEWLARRGL